MNIRMPMTSLTVNLIEVPLSLVKKGITRHFSLSKLHYI